MPRGDSIPTTWSIAGLAEAVQAAVDVDDSKRWVKLPQFQRAIVWKREQQEQLVDSIHEGLPIGSLLFAKQKNQDSFLLIDGLQRTNTLIAHQSHELELSTPPESVVQMIVDAVKDATGADYDLEPAASSLKSWMRKTRTTLHGDGFDTLKLAEHLGAALNPPLDLADVGSLASELGHALDELKVAVSIGDYQVPVIIYGGAHSNLPEIFERMNTGGTQLSKYQVYAASWSHHLMVFDDDEIKSTIRSKYQLYVNLDFYVEGLREDGYQDNYNLFEFLFGMGKVLADQYPLLFPAGAEDSDPESFVFSLVALVLGLSVSDVSRIPESPWFPRTDDGSYAQRNLRLALETGCKLVNEALEGIIALKLNQSIPKPTHPELLIVSLVACATLKQCDPEDDYAVDEVTGTDRDALCRAFRHHYLFDQIRRQWRGSAHALASSRVWSRLPKLEEDRFRDSGVPAAHYTSPVERARWESALDDWYREDQLDRVQSERPNIRASEKLFLRYLYAHRLTYAENLQTEFDIEHLYPVERLVALIKKDDSGGWPISCIANLAVLPKGLNRAKKSQTISEYAAEEERKGEPLSQSETEKLENYIVGEIDEIVIPKVGGEDKLSKSDYVDLLQARWERIQAALLENLDLN